VILAAHRFGYLEWTNEYRIKNSFFNLPKLNPGDEFEILWDQRHYKYKVAKVTEGEEIDDYSYDAILYTCKFLVSKTRIFVYAKRVN
jgi:sortase (surface protein transpeptidase)